MTEPWPDDPNAHDTADVMISCYRLCGHDGAALEPERTPEGWVYVEDVGYFCPTCVAAEGLRR